MKLGYARVSTEDQRLYVQRSRLNEAGCGRLFEEKVSGAARQRPALEQLLRELRIGDILVVTRLDRLARSTAKLRLSRTKRAGLGDGAGCEHIGGTSHSTTERAPRSNTSYP